MTAEPYVPAPVEVRRATADDLDAIAETLARAFYHDPVWGWAFADPDRRLVEQRAVWRFELEAALDYSWIWMTAGCASVALWIPPGKPELRPEDEERFEPFLRELCGPHADRVLASFERFDDAHPGDRPHYYLSLLATDPDHAGKGVGMGLLADCLGRIDAEGACTYLESTNPANHRRYERLGFRHCGEFEMPEGGPSVAQMWRDPR
jgi:ribosomal protein S18 acetylase RimI-like enzyme